MPYSMEQKVSLVIFLIKSRTRKKCLEKLKLKLNLIVLVRLLNVSLGLRSSIIRFLIGDEDIRLNGLMKGK